MKYGVSLVLMGAAMCACMQSDYTRLVKTELAKGVRHDSLLLGIRFGDSRNDFYGKCFDLNKKQLVTQGPGNMSVQYVFTDSIVHNKPTEIRMLFFPNFDEEETIVEMNMQLSYSGWAPWNPGLQSDSLKAKTMQLLMHWYKGNDFVMAQVNDSTQVPAKVDGNRRVLVSIADNQYVLVRIQDILHPIFAHSGTAVGKDEAKRN